MILQTLHGKIIGVIGDYFNLSIDLKFNDVSEISFSVPAYDNGVKSPFYDELQAFRMVEIDPYGIYVLTEPNTSGDGIKEVKDITAMSLEWLLSSRRVILQQGTYKLYSAADIGSDNPSTILGIVHSVAPEWGLQVDESLWNRYRTFDETDDGLLDWLSGEAAKSFGCLFCFDTYKRVIHVIDAGSDYSSVPIYLSYDNLVKTQDINVNTDDFFTVLSVYGADPVNIREVNPIGSNKIYNLDYFIENGDIADPLATKWRKWMQDVDDAQELFTTLSLLYNSAGMRVLNQNGKLDDLKTELALIENDIDGARESLNITPRMIDPAPPSQEGSPSQRTDTRLGGASGVVEITPKKIGSIYQLNELSKECYDIYSGHLSATIDKGSQKIIVDAEIVDGGITIDQSPVNPKIECGVNVGSGGITVTNTDGSTQSESNVTFTNAKITVSGVKVSVKRTPTVIKDKVYIVGITGQMGQCSVQIDGDNVPIDSLFVSSQNNESSSDNEDTDGQQENPVYNELIAEIEAKTAEKEACERRIVEAEAELAEEMQNEEEYRNSLEEIKNRLKLDSYFTGEELDILSRYFIESDFEDETFAVFDVDISSSKSNYINGATGSLEVICENEDEIIKVDTSLIDPDGIITTDYYMLNAGNFTVSIDGDSKKAIIDGTILSGTYCIDRAVDDPQVTCIIYAGAGTITVTTESDGVQSVEKTEFVNANFTIVGSDLGVDYTVADSELIDGTTYITSIIANVGSCGLTFTHNSTPFESYSVQRELYDYAREQHKSIAYPSCQFEIKSGNIIFAKEFESFKDHLKLGSGVYLELSDGTVLNPMLLEIHLDFEDATNFDLVFSNDYKRHDNVTSMKSLLEDAKQASRTLDMAKYNYGAFVSSGAQNEIQNLFTSLIDASSNQIAAGSGQSVIIDGTGITIRNDNDSDAPYIRMNNGMISMMDADGTSKLALGRFYDSDLGLLSGVVAPNLVGSLIAGENLIIKSSKTFGGIQTFQVDGDGVKLANGRFDLYKAFGSGDNVSYSKTISIDPELGIIVGSLDKAIDYNNKGEAVVNIFESQISTDIVAQVRTIEEAKDAVADDDENIISLANLSPNFWIDLDGSVFMRGTIYAVGGVIDMSQMSIEGGMSASNINGTLNATRVKIENSYGGVGVRSNQGAILYAVEESSVQTAGDYQNIATNYFLATSSNVRMQAGNSASIEITKSDNKIVLSGSEITLDAPDVWLQNGAAVISDRNMKNKITYDLSRYEQMFYNLKPAFYHMNSDPDDWHIGFVWQDVKNSLLSAGMTEQDFAGLVTIGSGDNVKYSLRYNEFVPLNTYMIQKLSDRIKVLEEQLRGMNGGTI